MFANLPHSIQQEILAYLETHNFPAAKQLYDRYKTWSSPKPSEFEYSMDLSTKETS
jgi:hypothetical protein